MVGNVIKTIGICLTSLGSFNIQEQRNAEVNTQTIIEVEYTQGNEDYLTRSSQVFPIANYQNINWAKGTGGNNYIDIDVLTLNQNTLYTHTYEDEDYYVSQYNTYPLTFSMGLIRVKKQPNYKYQTWIDEYYVNCVANNIESLKSKITIYEKYDSPEIDELIDASSYNWDMHDPFEKVWTQLLGNNKDLQWNKLATYYTENNNNQGTINILEQNTNPIYNKPSYYIILIEQQQLEYRYGGRYEYNTQINNSSSYYFTIESIDNPVNYEVIDVPGIMFEVLTMPFTFFSTAFNLTIFPGTPYQVNISTLFLSIIAILLFAFIIRTILKR